MGYFGTKQFQLKNGTSIVLRDPELSEAHALIGFLETVTKDGEGQILEYLEFTPTLEDERNWIENSRANPNEIIVAAYKDDQLIGLINLRQEKRQRLKHVGVFGMGIVPNWRSQGLGQILLAEMLEWLRLYSEIEIVQLSVIAKNQRAINLYQKLGFQVEGCRKNYIKYQNDEYDDEILMAISLVTK